MFVSALPLDLHQLGFIRLSLHGDSRETTDEARNDRAHLLHLYAAFDSRHG